MMPARKPIPKATAGMYSIPQEQAIATPPTSVAWEMSSTMIPRPWLEVTIRAAMVLPAKAQYVLTTIWER